MNEMLDWAEKAGIENLKGRTDNAIYLQKEGVTTLTVFLVGATGALAYVVKGIDSEAMWLAFGSGALSCYLFALAAVLVFKVLKIDALPAVYNEPMSLYQPDFDLESVKLAELKNIQKRIDLACSRNDLISGRLNSLRVAAVCSPIVFIIVSGVVALARLYVLA